MGAKRIMPLFVIDGEEIEMEQSEIDAHIAQIKFDAQNKENRVERNRRLAETDWWAVSDRTMTQAEMDYRQALRDITTHSNWPDLQESDWPTKSE